VSHISFGVDNLKFGDVAQFQHFQHVLGLNINFNSVDIQDGGLWDVVVSSLTLFLLQFDGNTSYSLVLKTFHQMGDETSDLVSEGFAGDDGNFLADTFVDMEIQRQSSVVFLDDKLGSFLNGLCTNSTHFEDEAGARRWGWVRSRCRHWGGR